MVVSAILSNDWHLLKAGNDKSIKSESAVGNCNWKRDDALRADSFLSRVCWELRDTQLVARATTTQHMHRALVRRNSPVLPIGQIAFKGSSLAAKSQCESTQNMKDFLAAAKATNREATPHQSAAWSWAWQQLTGEQQKEFYSIFNAGPEPKQGYSLDKAIELIKEWEGFSSEAYVDPITKSEPYAIGFGSTHWDDNSKVRRGDRITKPQAETLLANTIETHVVRSLSGNIPHWRKLTPERKAALVSFAYNVGWHFYDREGFETISRALREKDYDAMPRIMGLYVNPGSSAEVGLRRRRKAEGQLWGYPANSVLLKVAYETQHDNGPESYRECLSSSCGMLARYHGKVANDEDYNLVREQFGDTVEVNAHLEALRSLGLTARFDSAAYQRTLEAELRSGHPVALGWLHKGHVGLPRGFGHWCACIGIDEETGSYVMHDPYGEADMVNGGYLNHTNGCGIQYTKKNFLARWMPDGPRTGWMISVRR